MPRKSLRQFPIRVLVGAMLVPIGCYTQERAAVRASVAVDEIWKQYASSLNSGDIDAWVSLWTDNGIQMPPDSPPVIGKQQIRARNKAVLDQFNFDMRINNEELRVAGGNWAYARGTYTATLAPKAGGEPIFIDGKYMTILQRQPDGSWKIHRDIFNSNIAPGEN